MRLIKTALVAHGFCTAMLFAIEPKPVQPQVAVQAVVQGPLKMLLQSGPVDLGTLGGTFSQASGVDAITSRVAGSATIASDAATHGVMWAPKTRAITDLGVLYGGNNSFAVAVNTFANAAGTSEYSDPLYGLVSRAFIYKNSALVMLGTLGGSQSQGAAINELNQVVGYSLIAGDAANHAFVSDSSTAALSDLGTLGGTNSSAYAINNFGLAAGSAETAAFDSMGNPITDAVIWDLKKNVAKDLGTLGGTFAQVSGLNNLGHAAGFSSLASGQVDAFAYVNGKLIDLGTLGGSASQGLAINDFGVVVGFSNTIGDQDVHAFLWTAYTGMIDLNSLLPKGSPWKLTQASGVNDLGRIVGYGLINGEFHAFIW